MERGEGGGERGGGEGRMAFLKANMLTLNIMSSVMSV